MLNNPFANWPAFLKLHVVVHCLLFIGQALGAELIPQGITTWDEPKVFSRIGGEVSGVGNGPVNALKNSKQAGDVSIKQSKFSPAETYPQAQWRSHDYTLQGTDRPEIGALIKFQGGQSGEHAFINRSWEGFETAIQFGESVNDKGCDSTEIHRVAINNCTNGIVFRNKFAMTNTIDDVSTGNVKYDFVLYAGGKMVVRDVFPGDGQKIEDGSVVFIPGTQSKDLNNKGEYPDVGFGSNVNWCTFENVVLDDTAGNGKALLRIPRSLSVLYNVEFQGGSIAEDDYSAKRPQIDVWNPFTIRINGHKGGLQAGTFIVHHNPKRPPLTLFVIGCDGMRLKDVNGDGFEDAADLIDPNCSGYGHINIRSRDCTNIRGEIVRSVYARAEK